jgi:glyceraldehyde 3-phosphate dehydrogenase
MAVKVGINGFGRIGRLVFRLLFDRDDFEVVGINDLGDTKTMAHLLKYDSVHGRFGRKVEVKGEGIIVDGKTIPMFTERDPKNLPWNEREAYFVVEATGVFRHREKCAMHIEAGAQKVLLTVPPKDEIDAVIVIGVNDEVLTGEHKIISNASCTTNCLAPVAKILQDRFGIKRGLMTTIHAYTNDQMILDLPHKDLRRARAACENIIPTTTGAAKAVGQVIPELDGKLDGIAMRVPVSDGSVVDLVVELEKNTTEEEINAAVREYAEGPMKGILQYSEDPLVSRDVVGNPYSSIFDSQMTNVFKGNMAKVISWYDNEWGYSNRVVDLMALAAKM